MAGEQEPMEPFEILVQVHGGQHVNLSLANNGLVQVGIKDRQKATAKTYPYLHILNASLIQGSPSTTPSTNGGTSNLVPDADGNQESWVEISGLDDDLKIFSIKGHLVGETEGKGKAFVAELMRRSYHKDQKSQRKFKILINPKGGKGKAKIIWETIAEPIFKAAGCEVYVQYTERQAHAIDIISSLPIDEYDAVVCVSGDGLVHEIINGLAKRPDARKALATIPISQIPAGSGNALFCNIVGPKRGRNPAFASLVAIKGTAMPMDLCSVTQGDKRFFSFLSQSYGLMAYVDLGTEHNRWMGDVRFVLGYIWGALTKLEYEVQLDINVAERDKELMEKNMREERTGTGKKGEGESQPNISSGEQDQEGEGDGLPELKFGTVNDELVLQPQSDWITINAPISSVYAGKQPYAAPDLLQWPLARSDGLIDVAIVLSIGTKKILGMVDGADKGQHYYKSAMQYYKARAYRLRPKPHATVKGVDFISIDGEKVPFEPFQVEAHKSLGRVLSLSGGAETAWYLPKEWGGKEADEEWRGGHHDL